jgi:hypothetical protein
MAIAIFAMIISPEMPPGMPITKPKVQSAPSEAALLTKAVLRAAEKLGMANKSLAAVIGVSEATVSRMRSGAYKLQRGQKSCHPLLGRAPRYRLACDRFPVSAGAS